MASQAKKPKRDDDGDVWTSYWSSESTPPWHKTEPHPKLLRHMDLLTGGGRDKKVFLVPLCGKSRDLWHLHREGHTVVGTESSEKGCREFFRESELEFDLEDLDNGFKLFKSKDCRLKLFCGDHFALTREMLGGVDVDCVWDRGSLVAVNPEDRERYAKQMRTLLPSQFCYLLASVAYEGERDGPPHSVDFQEIKKLFGDFCDFKILEKISDDDPDKDHNEADSVPNKGDVLIVFISPKKKDDKVAYWQNRYADNNFPWHKKDPNWALEKYFDRVKDGRDEFAVFVPLCGKSVDLVWMYRMGHTVVGVEGVAFVAEAAFKESGMEYTKTYLKEVDGFLLQTLDSRLKVFSCDFFSITPELLGRKFDTVFDRGAFGAVNKEDREQYAKLIHSLVAPEYRILMCVNQYDDSGEFTGPPRNVPDEQVRNLFGEDTDVKHLEALESEEKAKRFNLDHIKESVYLIKKSATA